MTMRVFRVLTETHCCEDHHQHYDPQNGKRNLHFLNLLGNQDDISNEAYVLRETPESKNDQIVSALCCDGRYFELR